MGRSATVDEIMVRQVIPEKLEEFRSATGRYPSEKEGLSVLNGFQEERITDPWNREYVYRNPSSTPGYSYDIVCLGENGVEDSSDVSFSK
jgi:hypothetical protein